MSWAAFLKKIDFPLTPPLTALARFAAYLMGHFRAVPKHRGFVVRPGGLGDLICCHMALEHLGQDPREFLWLVERRSAIWAKRHRMPHLCYDDKFLSAILPHIGQFKTVVNTEQYFGLAAATAALGRSPDGTIFSFFSNRGLRRNDTAVPYSQNQEHERELFTRLFGAALGLPIPFRPFGVRKRLAPSEGHVLVALGGGLSPSRQLSPACWRAAINAFASHRSLLVLAGGSAERSLLETLSRDLPQAQILAPSFDVFADSVQHAEKVLTVDSGAVHVASYFGIPTVAMFTSGQEKKWAPLGDGSIVIVNDRAPCRPCTRWGQTPPCPHRFLCKELPF